MAPSCGDASEIGGEYRDGRNSQPSASKEPDLGADDYSRTFDASAKVAFFFSESCRDFLRKRDHIALIMRGQSYKEDVAISKSNNGVDFMMDLL